jgi:hypothetical protein
MSGRGGIGGMSERPATMPVTALWLECCESEKERGEEPCSEDEPNEGTCRASEPCSEDEPKSCSDDDPMLPLSESDCDCVRGGRVVGSLHASRSTGCAEALPRVLPPVHPTILVIASS